MSIEIVTWEELMREWEENPHKALLWLLSLIWRAGISPKQRVTWQIKNQQVIIGEPELTIKPKEA